MATKVYLDLDVRCCDCCHRRHMKKTIKVVSSYGTVNVGVVCAEKWFNTNCTGNIYKSVERLQRRLNTFSEEQMVNIIELIKTNGLETL